MAKNKIKPAAPRKTPIKSAPKLAEPASRAAKSSATMDKPSKKSALRESILARKAAIKPITFSLDEVRAIAKTNALKAAAAPGKAAKAGAKVAIPKVAVLERPAKPSHVKPASLAEILGFNPRKAKS